MDRLAQYICLWTGPLLLVTLVGAFVLIAGWVPPPGPALSAEEITRVYQENTNQIRVATLICISSLTLFGTWGAGVAMRLRNIREAGSTLFYAQLVIVAIVAVVSLLGPVFWQLAAFRPYETSPQVVQAFNDTAWFIFLVTWPPFSLWAIAVGMSIIADKRNEPEIPRWVGFFSFWVAILIAPAGLIAFLKTGPFAWNGLLAFYLAVSAFLVWIAVMSYFTLTRFDRFYESID